MAIAKVSHEMKMQTQSKHWECRQVGTRKGDFGNMLKYFGALWARLFIYAARQTAVVVRRSAVRQFMLIVEILVE